MTYLEQTEPNTCDELEWSYRSAWQVDRPQEFMHVIESVGAVQATAGPQKKKYRHAYPGPVQRQVGKGWGKKRSSEQVEGEQPSFAITFTMGTDR